MDLTNRTSVFSYSGNNIYAELNMNQNKIVNVLEPTNAQDVATKDYVDNSTAGSISSGDDLHFKTLRLDNATHSGSALAINGNVRLTGNNRWIGTTDSNTFHLRSNGNDMMSFLGGSNEIRCIVDKADAGVLRITAPNISAFRLNTTDAYGNTNNPIMRIGFNTTQYEVGRIEAITPTPAGGTFRGDLLFYTQFNGTLGERMRLTNTGRLGIGLNNPSEILHVQGNILASGTISGASKNFIIDHPNPSKKDTHNLIHTAIETNTRGTCFYEFNAYVEDSYILNLPSYFKYLICDDSVKCHITPIDELCMVCYKKIDNQNIQIRTSAPCNVSVLVSGIRKDDKAIQLWKGEEVLKVVKEEVINNTGNVGEET